MSKIVFRADKDLYELEIFIDGKFEAYFLDDELYSLKKMSKITIFLIILLFRKEPEKMLSNSNFYTLICNNSYKKICLK